MHKESSGQTGAWSPDYSRKAVVETVASKLAELKQVLPIRLLALSGLWNDGDPASSQETELLVIYGGPKLEDSLNRVAETIGIGGLKAQVYSEDEYANRRAQVDIIIAKGMVLYHEGGSDLRRAHRNPPWKRRMRWAGNGFLGIGLFMLLTTGAYYGYSYYSISQISEEGDIGQLIAPGAIGQDDSDPQSQFLASFLAGSPNGPAAALPPASDLVSNAANDSSPAAGIAHGPQQILPPARIIIPSIDVDSRIIETGIVFEEGEWQWERPKFAVGHLVGTANPGAPGNMVLSGHMSSPIRGEGQVFNRLPEIKLGDIVVVYTQARAFAYQVTGKKVVLPTEIGVLKTTDDETVTLITCVPDLIYDHRLIVTAKKVSES